METLKNKYIYTVTGVRFGFMFGDTERSADGIYHSYRKRIFKAQKRYFTIKEKRTWGWYLDLKTAKRAIRENWGDMYEGQYTHIVIEKVPEGVVVNTPTEEYWYRWVGPWLKTARTKNKKIGYKPDKKPKQYKNICSFWGGETK